MSVPKLSYADVASSTHGKEDSIGRRLAQSVLTPEDITWLYNVSMTRKNFELFEWLSLNHPKRMSVEAITTMIKSGLADFIVVSEKLASSSDALPLENIAISYAEIFIQTLTIAIDTVSASSQDIRKYANWLCDTGRLISVEPSVMCAFLSRFVLVISTPSQDDTDVLRRLLMTLHMAPEKQFALCIKAILAECEGEMIHDSEDGQMPPIGVRRLLDMMGECGLLSDTIGKIFTERTSHDVRRIVEYALRESFLMTPVAGIVRTCLTLLRTNREAILGNEHVSQQLLTTIKILNTQHAHVLSSYSLAIFKSFMIIIDSDNTLCRNLIEDMLFNSVFLPRIFDGEDTPMTFEILRSVLTHGSVDTVLRLHNEINGLPWLREIYDSARNAALSRLCYSIRQREFSRLTSTEEWRLTRAIWLMDHEASLSCLELTKVLSNHNTEGLILALLNRIPQVEPSIGDRCLEGILSQGLITSKMSGIVVRYQHLAGERTLAKMFQTSQFLNWSLFTLPVFLTRLEEYVSSHIEEYIGAVIRDHCPSFWTGLRRDHLLHTFKSIVSGVIFSQGEQLALGSRQYINVDSKRLERGWSYVLGEQVTSRIQPLCNDCQTSLSSNELYLDSSCNYNVYFCRSCSLLRNPLHISRASCGLCLDDSDEITMIVNECGHSFCVDCVKTLTDYRSPCPACRRSLDETQVVEVTLEEAVRRFTTEWEIMKTAGITHLENPFLH